MPRRVVTGYAANKAVFVSDGPVPTAHDYSAIPGFMTAILWSTAPAPQLADGVMEAAPRGAAILPGAVGGTTLVMVRIPPDSAMAAAHFDPAAAAAEQAVWLPGMNEHFDPAAPGMHRTDTVDYCVLLAGSIWLELDDGAARELHPGDVVIQRGTRHAWRNRSEQPATMLYVLIGAAPR